MEEETREIDGRKLLIAMMFVLSATANRVWSREELNRLKKLLEDGGATDKVPGPEWGLFWGLIDDAGKALEEMD